jgi:two-component system sensor histidine kinase/response regulator
MAINVQCQIEDQCIEPETVQVSTCQLASMAPLRVLLAEDSPAIQMLVRYILERRGHAVTVVGNGLEAVVQAGRQPFDVVLMDVQMPFMDGLQAVAAIRQFSDAAKARLPAIAMTLDGEGLDRERCLAAGMDGHIKKPIARRELIELVESLAARRGKRLWKPYGLRSEDSTCLGS